MIGNIKKNIPGIIKRADSQSGKELLNKI